MTTPAPLSMTDSPTYFYPGWPRLPHPGPKVLLGLQLRLGRKLRKEQKATGGRQQRPHHNKNTIASFASAYIYESSTGARFRAGSRKHDSVTPSFWHFNALSDEVPVHDFF